MNLALIQMDVVQEAPEKNLKHLVELAREAKKKGADILLFPEATLTDYVGNTENFAQEVPNGPACTTVKKLAEELGVYISFGLIEKDGLHRYITQVFFGPKGFVYKYRKTWLYSTTDSIKSKRRHRNEPDFFDPGHGPELFEIAGMKASCIICADAVAPRCLKIVGQIQPGVVFFPINMEIAKPAEFFSNIAKKCGAAIISANRVGTSWGEKCDGGSCVFSKTGELLAQANKDGKEEILMFDLGKLR